MYMLLIEKDYYNEFRELEATSLEGAKNEMFELFIRTDESEKRGLHILLFEMESEYLEQFRIWNELSDDDSDRLLSHVYRLLSHVDKCIRENARFEVGMYRDGSVYSNEIDIESDF